MNAQRLSQIEDGAAPTTPETAEAVFFTLSFFSLLAAAVGFIAWGLIAGGHC
jgi:hypothetical protein